eukprot:5259026-Prymnesium_polylepis.2
MATRKSSRDACSASDASAGDDESRSSSCGKLSDSVSVQLPQPLHVKIDLLTMPSCARSTAILRVLPCTPRACLIRSWHARVAHLNKFMSTRGRRDATSSARDAHIMLRPASPSCSMQCPLCESILLLGSLGPPPIPLLHDEMSSSIVGLMSSSLCTPAIAPSESSRRCRRASARRTGPPHKRSGTLTPSSYRS